MRGRSSGKTAPPATRASPGKAGGLKKVKYPTFGPVFSHSADYFEGKAFGF